MQVSWHPVSVLWGTVALLVLAGALVLMQHRTRRAGIGPTTRALLLLRLAAICAVVGYLFRPCLHFDVTGRVPLDLLVLWDRSESMGLGVAAGDTVSRLDAAVRWWHDAESSLGDIRGLQVRHAAFAESVTTITTPARLVGSPPGTATNLGVALDQADGLVAAHGRVLLISDGCHNSGPAPLDAARPSRVPVDVVVPWVVGHEADLRVDDLSGRRVVSSGDTAEVWAAVRWEALARPDSVRVMMTCDGVPVDSSVFAAGAGWGEREVALASPLTGEGLRVLRVTAEGPAEMATGNNSRSLSVEVAKATRVVGLLATAPHPDYAFLSRLLAADPSVSFVGGVLQSDGSLARGGSPRELVSAADLLVVVSTAQGSLAPGLCEQIAAWVRSGAKGLLWIGTALPSCSSLASLIPAEASREVRAIRAVGPALGATTHPVVGFATGPWEDMPPLVVNTEARSLQGSVVPLVSTQEGVPALVMASGGHRRLAWLNSGTLWRWFLGEHGTVLLAQGLVERLIAWLGQSGGPVRLNLSQAADALVAEVQVYDLDWRPLDGCLPELKFSDSSGNLVADLDLGAVVGAEGFYRGRTGPLPPGRLRYELVVRSGETAIGRNQGWVNVEATDRERATAVACTGVLREIARVSGGRYYGFADAAAWMATLSRLGVHRISLCPWRGGWWALVALILLCGEWYLRRRIGLP